MESTTASVAAAAPDPAPSPAGARRCWLLTEGHAGMENQCIGLAQALGLAWELRRVHPGAPWIWLPPALWWRPLRESAAGVRLEPPWPEVVISCGRRSVAAAMAIRRCSARRSFTVHIQDPHVDPRRFDVVVVPAHDRLRGDNVIVTRGALHGITRARLEEAGRRFAPRFAHLPRPLVAVLVGGSNRRQQVSPAVIEDLAARLGRVAREQGAGLAVTPSRRTGVQNERILRERLAGLPAVVWDGSGENPYLGMLALADAVVVSADSVSMVSEACATGRPVHVYELEGGSRRLRRFHRGLREAGITRPFTGRLEHWSYAPLDETLRVADIIARRLGGHGAPAGTG